MDLSAQIVEFYHKLSRLTDLKNMADHGSASDSRLCLLEFRSWTNRVWITGLCWALFDLMGFCPFFFLAGGGGGGK